MWHPRVPAPSHGHEAHSGAFPAQGRVLDPDTAPCSLPRLGHSRRGTRATLLTPTSWPPRSWGGKAPLPHVPTSLYSLIQYSLPATWSRLSPTGSSMDTTVSSRRFEPSMPAAAMTVRPLCPRLTQYSDLGAGTQHPLHRTTPVLPQPHSRHDVASTSITHPGARGQPWLARPSPCSGVNCQLFRCHVLPQHCHVALAIAQPRTDGCRVAAGPVQLPCEPVHGDAVHLAGTCGDRAVQGTPPLLQARRQNPVDPFL